MYTNLFTLTRKYDMTGLLKTNKRIKQNEKRI